MANPKHLEILTQGWPTWNEWREEHASVIPDLSRINLTGISLRTANLRGVNLTKSNLKETNLTGVRFSGADLSGANLIHADLQMAHLDGAKLLGTELIGANLRFADLRGADLSRSVIGYVNFERTKLYGAIFSQAIAGFTTFKGADLGGAKGLESVFHQFPSSIDVETLSVSVGRIPEAFLRGCGVPEPFIVQLPALVAAIEPIQFYSCFISYSSRDEEFAERLRTDLQAKGVRVWFAPHDLPIGARIRPTIDESIRVHEKLLLVLSEASVASQWVEQEVETALAREREQEGRTVLFPIRIDGAVMESKAGWPALLKNTRNVGDFTRWKDHDSYQKVFERLLRDLKAEEPTKPTYMTPDSLENRAVLSPRDTFLEGWKGVGAAVIQAAKHNELVSEGELVDYGLLINQLHEEGKISDAVREEYFLLSKWHRSVAFNSLSSVEPQTAIYFVSRARVLQKALAVDTPPLR